LSTEFERKLFRKCENRTIEADINAKMKEYKNNIAEMS
jgi:hypothetical protein